MSTVAKDLRPGASCWEAVGGAIAQLVGECSKLLPAVLESENVVKSKSPLLCPLCCLPALILTVCDSHRYTALDRTRRRNPSERGGQRRGRAQSCTVPRRDSGPCPQSQVEGPNHPRVDRENRTHGTSHGSEQEAIRYDRRARSRTLESKETGAGV